MPTDFKLESWRNKPNLDCPSFEYMKKYQEQISDPVEDDKLILWFPPHGIPEHVVLALEELAELVQRELEDLWGFSCH